MGENAAETVREIESTRARLDGEIRELETRLPRPAVWTKRIVGVAVGGGIGGSLFWFAARKVRNRNKEKKVQATAVQPVINVLPEKWAGKVSDALEDGRWKPWAMAVGGVWVVLRLAELRQMRKMNRMIVTGVR